MAKIKIEISINKQAITGKDYEVETFETSFEGDQQSYLYLISQILPLIPKEA